MFECNHGAVLSLAIQGDTIFAGCQEGYVQVFDLETKTLVDDHGPGEHRHFIAFYTAF
ncbi:hypothetical protein HD554DRAFT_2125388 [Boletus coccyginus]|nr:hypothetical protein HD554DRAFT_2125388 [Boletus coccyginus]